MTARRAYRISGRVQGVGFRWWARDAALGLGVRGIVRNDPDGTVYLEAAGDPDRLADLEARLRSGPPHSRVDRVAMEEPGSDALPSTFEITRC
jgi:acylphosphatase